MPDISPQDKPTEARSKVSFALSTINRKDRKGQAAETTDPAGYQCVSGCAQADTSAQEVIACNILHVSKGVLSPSASMPQTPCSGAKTLQLITMCIWPFESLTTTC